MQSSRQATRLLARRAALAASRSVVTSAAVRRRPAARISTPARALSSAAKTRTDTSSRAKSSMAMAMPAEEDYAFTPFSQVRPWPGVRTWHGSEADGAGHLA